MAKRKNVQSAKTAAGDHEDVANAMDIALLLGEALVGRVPAIGIKIDTYRRYRAGTGDAAAATKAATVATAGLGVLEAARRLGERHPGLRLDIELVEIAAEVYERSDRAKEAETCRGLLAVFRAHDEEQRRLRTSSSILGPDGAPAVVEVEPEVDDEDLRARTVCASVNARHRVVQQDEPKQAPADMTPELQAIERALKSMPHSDDRTKAAESRLDAQAERAWEARRRAGLEAQLAVVQAAAVPPEPGVPATPPEVCASCAESGGEHGWWCSRGPG